MELNLRKDDVARLHCAKAILEKEFKSHYTANQLAQRVGTNEYKLKNGFKQLFNISPYKFLTKVRIEIAQNMLEFYELPVKVVAVRVGITDIPTFIKCFKRITGVCPSEWRRSKKHNL